MKKTTAIVLIVLLTALALCSCGAKNEAQKQGDTMALADLMDKVEGGVEELPMVGSVPLDADNFSFYTFADMPTGAEGLASEAMVNAIAHSAVLVRVSDGTSASDLAKEMEKNADPRKWICAEAEKVTVTVHGNTILLVMSTESIADAMTANFDALWA